MVERGPVLITDHEEPRFVAQSSEAFEAMVRRLRNLEQASTRRQKLHVISFQQTRRPTPPLVDELRSAARLSHSEGSALARHSNLRKLESTLKSAALDAFPGGLANYDRCSEQLPDFYLNYDSTLAGRA